MLITAKVNESHWIQRQKRILVGLRSKKCKKLPKAFTTQPLELERRCLGKHLRFSRMSRRNVRAWVASKEERCLLLKWTSRIFNQSMRVSYVSIIWLKARQPIFKIDLSKSKTATSPVSKSTKMWYLTFKPKSESTVLVLWTSLSQKVMISTYYKVLTSTIKNKKKK